MTPQCASVLSALRKGPMTSLEIYVTLGVYRAGARVFDLRGAGHRIATDMVSVRNRNGEPCRVARYALLPTDDHNLDIWETTNAAA